VFAGCGVGSVVQKSQNLRAVSIKGNPLKSKMKVVRFVLAFFGASVAGSVYALDVNGILPLGTKGGWHVSEAIVLVLQGLLLFLVARAVRRGPKPVPELTSAHPSHVVALKSNIQVVAKSA